MKVLVFTTQFHLQSGAERLAVELAVNLNRRGVHADVLSLYDESHPGVATKTSELLAAGVPSVRFLALPVNPPVRAIVRAIGKLHQLVHDNGYDVVETSQLSPAVIAAWATLPTRCRHVCGVHAVFRRNAGESRQLRIWRTTAWLVRTSRYYAISRHVAECWARFTALRRERIRVIYNGINDAAFQSRPDRDQIDRELALPSSARIALFVGRLDQFKGVDTALEALGPVLEYENLMLIYVGHAELADPQARAMIEAVQSRIREKDWVARVRFLGRREDVFRLMASSDVLVHPARTEGFGLVLAEAMATGLPIVASDVDGIPEVLSDTDSQMVPPNDPEAIRAATLRVLHWSALERRTAVEKGRHRALAFRSELRTSAMLDFMQGAVSPQAR